MARTLVNGAVLSIAATYGVDKTFSSISNASPPVASFASDPALANGDLVEVTSGWEDLSGAALRISATTGTGPYLASFEGFDATSTGQFPPGEGTGTVREVATWQSVSQILSISFSGGEQQFLTYQYLSQNRQTQVPTSKSPVVIALELHDDITAAGQIAITAAEAAAVPYAIRLVAQDGKKFYSSGYWSLGPAPIFESNNILRRTVSISLVAPFAEYSS